MSIRAARLFGKLRMRASMLENTFPISTMTISLCLRAGLLLLLTCYLGLPSRAAEPASCTFGGAAALEGAVSFGKEVQEGPDRDELRGVAAHTALLAFLVVTKCPATAERVISRDESATASWMGSLQDDLKSALPANARQPVLRLVVRSIRCTSSYPGLCAVRHRLQVLSEADHSRKVANDVCEALGPVVTEGLTRDLMTADGAGVPGRTHDVATVLSLCPDQFYVFMHSHHLVLTAWLQQADSFLFWGDPSYKTMLDEYRDELIAHIKASLQQSGFMEEKKEILAHFVHASVMLTQ